MDNDAARGKVVGILALQGDFEAHRHVLEDRLNTAALEVRTPADLDRVDALILPGGESTTIVKLLDRIGLIEPIRKRAAAGMPAYGTCAGMILMAHDVEGRPDQPTLDLMDITVSRNAFGRQIDSFEADVQLTMGEPAAIHAVFIRAPFVSRAGPDVATIARVGDRTVGVRQGALLATAFHPELTDDETIHALFARMVAGSQEQR